MRFMHIGAQALLAFTTILSGVASAPVGDDVLIADDAVLETLSQRDVYIAPNDALSALSSRDNGSSLAKRKDKGPPTGYDFEHFFANHFMDTSLMVFWYGTGHDKAKDFALAKGRNTLEMILGDTWHYYQTIKPDGKWDNWTDADTHFWGPISKAAGRASTGEVYVFSSEDKNIDRQVDDTLRVNCPTCWYLGEKPALIERLGEGKVAQITKFLQSDSNKIVGVIKEMGD